LSEHPASGKKDRNNTTWRRGTARPAAGGNMADQRPIDVTALIDAHPIGALQIRTLVLCGLAALLDGLDMQSIGLAAPGIIAFLHVPPHSFGLVFSAALLGLMLGAFGLGPVADRIGRRRILIGALVIIGVFTFCTAFAPSFETLLVLRFLAGIGLGGAMPSFISLGSEYAPRRRRAVMVGLLWAGFPLGGVLGGVLGSFLIPAFGWQSLFYAGGVLPILLAAILLPALPESLGFLVARGSSSTDVASLIHRITGTRPPPGARFILGEERVPGMPLRHLFTNARGPGTILLWIAYFMIFLILVTNTAWSPVLLHNGGMPVAQAAIAMAVFNGGSVVGTSLVGLLITRFDAFRSLAVLCVISAVCFALIGQAAPSALGTTVLEGTTGLFLGAGSSGLIAVAAIYYPTVLRSTGVGWAMGVGRFGSFTGPLVVGVMVGGGWDVASTYAAVCLIALGRHQRGLRAASVVSV
jgi:AAHS family 4-hydroxybenzoate transporter-like MFS transporter